MNRDISDMIYAAAKEVIDIYPVVADVEEFEKLPLPYAVYRIEQRYARTKEQRRSEWEVGFLVVANGYSECWALTAKLETAIEGVSGKEVVAKAIGGNVQFDGDDRVYIGETTVEIIEL